MASAWYEKNIPGGRRITEAPDRIMYGSTRLMFLRNATAKPSAGSAIDHIGFSVADLDAKMKEWEAAGIKITRRCATCRSSSSWRSSRTRGARASRSCRIPSCSACTTCTCAHPNPEEGFAWLLDKFGGKTPAAEGHARRDPLRLRGLQQRVDPGARRAKRSRASATRSITSAGARSARSPTPSTACARRRSK